MRPADGYSPITPVNGAGLANSSSPPSAPLLTEPPTEYW